MCKGTDMGALHLWTVLLMSLSCLVIRPGASAVLIDSRKMEIMKNKNVSSVRQALTAISRVRCADYCFNNRQKGACNLAGYHELSETCYLSMDMPQQLLNVADSGYSVIIFPGPNLSQWVESIYDLSSQWTSSTDSFTTLARELIGPPDVYPNYGGDTRVWSPASPATGSFVEVMFQQPVYISSVNVYETWYSGALKAIKCYTKRSYHTLWSTNDINVTQAAIILSPPLTRTCFSNRIRIETHATGGSNWFHMDAIQLEGNLI